MQIPCLLASKSQLDKLTSNIIAFDIIHCTQPNRYPTIMLSYLRTFGEAASIS